MRAELERFLTAEVGRPVLIDDICRVSSVGNAREPWSFTARWDGSESRCVMLVKAAAGQLETTLRPEYETIAALAGSGVPVPQALWLDDEGEAFGSPFFVTGWVEGSADTRILRAPQGDTGTRSTALDLAAAAAALHRVDPAAFTHLDATTVHDAARCQLDHWNDLLVRHRLEPHPALVYAVRWLRQRLPVARRISVVHGDLRFGNLLSHNGRLTALLDWEMTHLGDAVEDLGWVYRALWSPANSLSFDEFLAAYEEASGEPVDREQLRWYQVFCEVKHSVISLTGTRSFADGATSALRHADRSATIPPFIARVLELTEPC